MQGAAGAGVCGKNTTTSTSSIPDRRRRRIQYIERLSFELRGRRRVRVATSDNLEQLIILGHGAERISAQHFHDEVYTAQAEIERILAQNNQKNAE